MPWREEVDQQIGRLDGNCHWHHFYAREELEAVLKQTGFDKIDIAEGYYVCAQRL